MATKGWAIGLMALCTALTSVAQVFYKAGADRLEISLLGLITNIPLIAGMAMYLIGAAIMITAFKGGEVSVLYPIIATSYIWVSLMSAYFFNEDINIFKWIGICAIIAGIVFISIGSKEKGILKHVDVI